MRIKARVLIGTVTKADRQGILLISFAVWFTPWVIVAGNHNEESLVSQSGVFGKLRELPGCSLDRSFAANIVGNIPAVQFRYPLVILFIGGLVKHCGDVLQGGCCNQLEFDPEQKTDP